MHTSRGRKVASCALLLVALLSTPFVSTARAAMFDVILHVKFGSPLNHCQGRGICGASVEVTSAPGESRASSTPGRAVVKGNTLILDLPRNAPAEDESLPVDADLQLDEATSKALGFTSVIVLKGDYKIDRAASKFGTVTLAIKTK